MSTKISFITHPKDIAKSDSKCMKHLIIEYPIAKLFTGNDYLNPAFDLIIDDIIEPNQKQKLYDFINKCLIR